MDLSQVTNVVSQVTSDSTQGVQGHHHHHRSMADMISKMESAIDDALKAKTLTEDQAGQMKKELDSITQTLQQAQSSGTRLTSDQLQQIRAEFQDVRKQLFDALNPQGTTATSPSQVTSDSTQRVRGHHHHHHRSMADMISNMESAMDDLLKAGKLTEDQAGQMKKELDSIAQTLQQGQSSGTQLTSDQLQQIRTEFQDVRKQLFDALNPKAETTTSNGIGSLFQKIDANGDGVVDQNEFFTFISTLE